MISLLAAALATPTDGIGMPVASVALEAPRGGLPDESLEALLRVVQGEPLRRSDLRQDLTTLHRIGTFASVEAFADPWVAPDETGVLVPAVNVRYRVLPAPRAVRFVPQGNVERSTRWVLDAAGAVPGEVFHPALDGPEMEQRVVDAYRRAGFVNAVVEVSPVQLTPDTYEIWIRVLEGAPNVLREMVFVGDIPPEVDRRTLRRWARANGLREGRVVSQEAIRRAQLDLRQRLARVTGSLGRPRRGWINARVSPNVTRDEDGQVDLTWAVEPGPRLDLSVVGLGWRAQRTVRDALGIDERLRLTRGFVDEADERLADHLRRDGYHQAEATVELREGGDRMTLHVEVDRGARHTLRGQPPRRSLVVRGNEALTDAELVRVADQASPDVIRLDYYTADALEKGLAAMQDVYRSRGYQEASVTLSDLGDRRVGTGLTRPFIAAWSRLIGRPPPRRLLPVVEVDEGPLTLQQLAEIAGAAPAVGLADLRDELRSLAGEPFDPLRLDAVAREIVERHRDRGHLAATVTLRHDERDPASVVSVLEVDPGPQILLRTVVTRGPRLTRPSFIRREVDLVRGRPLSSTALEEARRRLYGLGIFSSVSTSLLGEGEQRDLLLTVDERPRWAAEAGGGVNTDQGARLIGRLTRRNLLGRAHRMDAYALLGVDYISDSVTDWRPDLRNLEWRAAISYTAPHTPSGRSDLVFDVLLQERRQELTWRMDRTGVGVVLDTRITDDTIVQGAVRAEVRNLAEVDRRALLTGEVWKDLLEDPDAASRACFPCRVAPTVQVVLLHDERDDPVRPTRGLLATGSAEWSPDLLGNRSPYVKAEARMAGFVPLGGPTLLLSMDAGLARGLGGSVVPLEDRFRLGGTGSLRGFRRQNVGPRNLAPRVQVDWPDGIAPILGITDRDRTGRWVPTGGDTAARGTAELLLPLTVFGLRGWDGYAAALFADVGNVWQVGPGSPTSNGDPDVPAVRYGIGVGARVTTPVGPLQLDVAANPTAAFASGAREALLVDGWEEPPVRAHLSLGTLW